MARMIQYRELVHTRLGRAINAVPFQPTTPALLHRRSGHPNRSPAVAIILWMSASDEISTWTGAALGRDHILVTADIHKDQLANNAAMALSMPDSVITATLFSSLSAITSHLNIVQSGA
jgi:hypothetical protein